ncbi:MAG: threonine aldolase [Euryarchaeota archaeon]|nr:threonine aldolase [Euryarchaeota archaeon]
MTIIDLRCDSLTLPTEEMLNSMRQVGVNSDILGNNQLTHEIQELAAQIFGAEDALFLTSSSQSNIVALLTHCSTGDKFIVGSKAHIYRHGTINMALTAQLIPELIKDDSGIFNNDNIYNVINNKSASSSIPKLLLLENTHDYTGGTCWTPDQVAKVAKIAHESEMKVHIDGTRIFNASVALGTPVSSYMHHVDSIQFSLHHGLSCPMGSILVGTHDFINSARKVQEMIGGNIQKSDLFAAPGIIALKSMIHRLADDHTNAHRLADNLEILDEIVIDYDSIQTNMVIADISATGMSSKEFIIRARDRGLLISCFGETTVRFVTHRNITAENIDQAAMIIESLIPSCPSGVCSI